MAEKTGQEEQQLTGVELDSVAGGKGSDDPYNPPPTPIEKYSKDDQMYDRWLASLQKP